MIPPTFINHAAAVLAETTRGLSGSKIAEHCSAYAVEYGADIPHSSYPFSRDLPNKRTALKENLQSFSPEQQFKIIKDLCELDEFKSGKEVRDLKIKLITRYGNLNAEDPSREVNEALIEETKHWLSEHPESLRLYESALSKYEMESFQRNLLDDLRLSLEILLKSILDNDKSLENQQASIGVFLEKRGTSKELRNMFLKVIDYYTKFHNSYVKHNDSVPENELEIIMEMTSSFMKFLIKQK